MKKPHSIFKGAVVGAIGLPLVTILCAQIVLWLDFPPGWNRHISGAFEVTPAIMYFLLCLFHVPLGIVLGVLTASASNKIKQQQPRIAERIYVSGGGLLLSALMCFLFAFAPNAYPAKTDQLRNLIVLILWLGFPAIWAFYLLIKGFKLSLKVL